MKENKWPHEEVIQLIEIAHPTDPTKAFKLTRNRFGRYWLESESGEGMSVDAFKLFEMINFFFLREF